MYFSRSVLTAAATLIAAVGSAQTNVGGPIVADATWDLAGSPYIVQTSIVIGANATLTIDAGVEVQVNPDLSIAVGSQAFGPGGLIVNGDAANRVLFSSLGGTWNDIFFTDFAIGTVWDVNGDYVSGSRLLHCTILGAGGSTDTSTGAVSIDNVSLELVGVTIRGSARDGLEADYDDNITGMLVIMGCTFDQSQEEGLDIFRGNGHLIVDSTFSSNGFNGFRADSSDFMDVDNSTFEFNGQSGMNWSSCDQSVVQNSEFRQNISEGANLSSCANPQYLDNLAIDNGNSGARLFSCQSALVSGSRFEGNTASQGGGLHLTSTSGSLDTCEFIDNVATFSGGGVHVVNGLVGISNSAFIGNAAAFDGGGLDFANGTSLPPLEGNRFLNNSSLRFGGAVYINSTNQTVQECSFENNDAPEGGAVYVASPGASFAGDQGAGTYNTFTGNTADFGAAIYNNIIFNPNGDGDIDASFVCWGTEDFAEIGARIHDFFDDGNLGIVGIFPPVACVICPADVNGDGFLTPADFSAWINAFNNNLPACDQNADGFCTPADFTAWIANFNAGC